jgi:hypothetical protein
MQTRVSVSPLDCWAHVCTAHAHTAHVCTAHVCTAHVCTAHARTAHAHNSPDLSSKVTLVVWVWLAFSRAIRPALACKIRRLGAKIVEWKCSDAVMHATIPHINHAIAAAAAVGKVAAAAVRKAAAVVSLRCASLPHHRFHVMGCSPTHLSIL